MTTVLQAPLRILIVDDHTAVRLGLTALILSMPGLQVVGEATDGEEALSKYAALRPDVVTLDLRMPKLDGLAVVDRLVAMDAAARILVMTMHDQEEDVSRAVRSGAKGFILKSAPREDILEALRQVGAGGSYFPAYVASKLASYLSTAVLTPRERQVLDLIRFGLSNKEIGKQLNMTEGTVKTHVREILGKLHAVSRTEAVHLAIQRGLLN